MLASATFTLGALAGGAATFGGLALLGAALGSGGAAALAVAAVVAVAAAAAEARGLRIAPQIRRQVPEAWRRERPVALAAAGYGVLLGLGFTTFVLTFAVWALAGVSIALGDPALGLAAGLAFGLGRALPVVALAPRAQRRPPSCASARDPARPAPRRRCRARRRRPRPGDRARVRRPARAAQATPAILFAGEAYDPATASGVVAWQRPNGVALVRRDGADAALPGRSPALGGGTLAWLEGEQAVIADAAPGGSAPGSPRRAPA